MSSGHGQIVVIGAAQEAEAVGQDFERALAEHQAVLLDAFLEDLEDEILLLETGIVAESFVPGARQQLRHGHLLQFGDVRGAAFDLLIAEVGLLIEAVGPVRKGGLRHGRRGGQRRRRTRGGRGRIGRRRRRQRRGRRADLGRFGADARRRHGHGWSGGRRSCPVSLSGASSSNSLGVWSPRTRRPRTGFPSFRPLASGMIKSSFGLVDFEQPERAAAANPARPGR